MVVKITLEYQNSLNCQNSLTCHVLVFSVQEVVLQGSYLAL